MKTKTYKKAFLSLAVVLGLLPYGANAREKLTLDRAVAIALEQNPSFRAAATTLEIANAERRQAGLIENPELSFESGFSGSAGNTYRLHASQNVLDIYLASLRRKAASSYWTEEKLKLVHDAALLAGQVKSAFYRLQAAEQLHQVLQSSLQAADTAAAFSDRQQEAGNINKLENNAWHLLSEESQLELARNETERRAARAELAALLGRSREAGDFTISNRLPGLPSKELSLARLETLAQERRMDVSAVRHRSQTLEAELKLARSRAIPAVTLGVETEREEDITRTGFAVGLRIPLFDRGQAEKSRVRAAMAQNRFAVAALEAAAVAQIRASYARMKEARTVAERLRQHILPLLDKTADEALKHYNYMLKGVFDLLQIRKEKLAAQREHIEALRDYWIERSQLEAAVGGSFH